MAYVALAGGCFWCMAKPFISYLDIEDVVSGYSGGDIENPTYEQVCSDRTGHREAIQIAYSPDITSFKNILDVYFKIFDPTNSEGQLFDRGENHEPAIFYRDEQQKKAAELKIQQLDGEDIFKKPIIIPVFSYRNFYPAEDYHQDYYKKDSMHYEQYQRGSGRKAFIRSHWGSQND